MFRISAKVLGGAINNCVAIMEGSDGPRILVGNNDETIKIVTIPDLGIQTTINLDAAVNYSIV